MSGNSVKMYSFSLIVGGAIILLAIGYGALIKFSKTASSNPIVQESGDVIEEVLEDSTGIGIDINNDGFVGTHDSTNEVIANAIEGQIEKIG